MFFDPRAYTILLDPVMDEGRWRFRATVPEMRDVRPRLRTIEDTPDEAIEAMIALLDSTKAELEEEGLTMPPPNVWAPDIGHA